MRTIERKRGGEDLQSQTRKVELGGASFLHEAHTHICIVERSRVVLSIVMQKITNNLSCWSSVHVCHYGF